jgi:UDP-glucose 4-epimerase
MKIAVTGASGYLGGRLIKYLASNKSYEIIAASRQILNYKLPVSWIKINWGDDDSISALCQNTDVIIHLASKNEQDSENNYQSTLLENGLAGLKLIEAAENASVRRFIYMSSIKVFGGHKYGPIKEDTLAQPQSSYGITHKLVEDYLLAKHRKGTIEGVVLRLSNAVGVPYKSTNNMWALIANDFCRQAAMTGEITLNSPGHTWRNFIAITDIEKAFDTVLHAPAKSLEDGLFNLGSTNSMRIIDLAKIIATRAGLMWQKKIKLNHPQPNSNTRPTGLDWNIDKLSSLGWQPNKNALIEEIDNTLKFCSRHFSR